MDDGVREMSDKSATVARAAGEMSQNMNSVAAASEQASTNVGLVASAMDGMNQTVAEIGKSSDKARTVTSRAVDEARHASSKVDSLGQAAAAEIIIQLPVSIAKLHNILTADSHRIDIVRREMERPKDIFNGFRRERPVTFDSG